MGHLSTHVLDTVSGRPAAGVSLALYRIASDGSRWRVVETETNDDGRTDKPLLDTAAMETGTYELVFRIGDYFRLAGIDLPEPAFLDLVPLRFGIADRDGHYHVPLLASPWAYSTYRGS